MQTQIDLWPQIQFSQRNTWVRQLQQEEFESDSGNHLWKTPNSWKISIIAVQAQESKCKKIICSFVHNFILDNKYHQTYS